MGSDRKHLLSRISIFQFQSTLPAWGATRVQRRQSYLHTISIHAPRMGSDFRLLPIVQKQALISIHAPRMGSDLPWKEYISITPIFQSTLPAWGATASNTATTPLERFQSTLPARGATTRLMKCLRKLLFQSTLPARGATHSRQWAVRCVHISIHAPREGSDLW